MTDLFCGLRFQAPAALSLRRRRLYSSFTYSSFHYEEYSEAIRNPRVKKRAALSLPLDPEPVREILRSVRETIKQDWELDRVAFSAAIKNAMATEKATIGGWTRSHIRQFLAELKTRPGSNTERYAGHAMVLFGHADMIDHAIDTFLELKFPSVYSLNSLLLSCILAGDSKQMTRVFTGFPTLYGIKPNLDTYATVVKAFSESGESSSAYSVLTDMDREGVRPNSAVFADMVSGFYKEGKIEDVGKVVELMNNKYGLPHGVTIYNSRIQSLCKLKRFSEAKSLFEEMLVKDLVPNAATYCSLIRGLCEEERENFQEAKSLFKSMASRRHCESAEARDLIEEVQHKFERWDEIEAILPKLETCMTIASSYSFVN